MNWVQYKDLLCCLWVCGWVVDSLSLTQEVLGSNPVILLFDFKFFCHWIQRIQWKHLEKTPMTLRGFKIIKNKVASTGNWTHNTSHLCIRNVTALTYRPHRHLLNRKSLNWTCFISGSIEHDFIRIWKSETGFISGSIEHDFIRIWKSETGTDWHIGWVGTAVMTEWVRQLEL